MQFCYLVMTHQNPEQIGRLVRTLLGSSDNGWVVLLHDRKGCSLRDVPALGDARVEVLVSPVDIHRGDFSQVEAYLYALEFVQQAERPWQWLICLSGQDYPVRSLRETEALLANSPCDAYLHHWEVGGPDDVWRPRQGRIRYLYRYRALPDWTRPALRALKWTHAIQDRWRVLTTYGPRLGTRVAQPPFGADFKLYGGYVWHYLRRECARYVLEFCRENPQVVAHYRGCIAPDESFLATVLANADFRVCNDSRRYVEWRDSRDGRPRVLTVADLPAMCSGAYDFARKFDPAVDARVLDLLDARIASGPAVAAPA